jgi:hypothetical protein
MFKDCKKRKHFIHRRKKRTDFKKFDVSADEDAAMREAIKIVFDKSQHINCRWHIIRM